MEDTASADKKADTELADGFGVLVGWTSESLGDRMILKLESIRSALPRSDDNVHLFRYFLTRNQAAVLANYLYEISGLTPARPRRRGWLSRLLHR